MITPPYPEFDEILTLIGEAGQRLSEIEASEGAAGNISVCLRWQIDPRRRFPLVQTIDLPMSVPGLAGSTFLITGAGRRLREVIKDPAANLGCLVIDPGGHTGSLYTSPRRDFLRLTSEFNTHLAVHFDQVMRTNTNYNAVVHAQPLYLTYLSHIPRYQDELYLNRHILRWQPESILELPEGVGFIPFRLPASVDLELPTVMALRSHKMVVWGKHGVMACSDDSVKRAADRIEYAETGARYEYINLVAGELGEGLSDEDIVAICEAASIKQEIFHVE